jgi:hypothetical protein
MRQPANAILQALVDALPDEALRPLVLALLQNGASVSSPVEPAQAPRRTRTPRIVIAKAKRRGGWPKGKPRKRGPGRPRLDADSAAAKREARREPNNLLARERRAVARAARTGASSGGNGAGKAAAAPCISDVSPSPEAGAAAVTPARFWDHAKALAPTKPWRAVARELGINEAVALDCHRNGSLPPGLSVAAITRFLELPTS